MQIKFSVRGLKELQDYLHSLPRGVRIAAMRAFSEYVVGDESHGLKHEPSQKTHGPDNPYQWQSEKQRKAFFATDGFGQGIPTVRTHEGVNSWTVIEKDSNWTQVKIEGGNKFVQGEWQQRGHAADGWRKYTDIIKTNMTGALRAANVAVQAWLRKKGR